MNESVWSVVALAILILAVIVFVVMIVRPIISLFEENQHE